MWAHNCSTNFWRVSVLAPVHIAAWHGWRTRASLFGTWRTSRRGVKLQSLGDNIHTLLSAETVTSYDLDWSTVDVIMKIMKQDLQQSAVVSPGHSSHSPGPWKCRPGGLYLDIPWHRHESSSRGIPADPVVLRKWLLLGIWITWWSCQAREPRNRLPTNINQHQPTFEHVMAAMAGAGCCSWLQSLVVSAVRLWDLRKPVNLQTLQVQIQSWCLTLLRLVLFIVSNVLTPGNFHMPIMPSCPCSLQVEGGVSSVCFDATGLWPRPIKKMCRLAWTVLWHPRQYLAVASNIVQVPHSVSLHTSLLYSLLYRATQDFQRDPKGINIDESMDPLGTAKCWVRVINLSLPWKTGMPGMSTWPSNRSSTLRQRQVSPRQSHSRPVWTSQFGEQHFFYTSPLVCIASEWLECKDHTDAVTGLSWGAILISSCHQSSSICTVAARFLRMAHCALQRAGEVQTLRLLRRSPWIIPWKSTRPDLPVTALGFDRLSTCRRRDSMSLC